MAPMVLIFAFVIVGLSTVCSAITFNAALKKATDQSSLYSAAVSSDKAVDGDPNPPWENYACASIDHNDLEPWWQVDLGRNYHVTSVLITNRLGFSNRLHDVTVTVSSDNTNPGTECGLHPGTVPGGATVTITCLQLTWGRYVKISKPTTGTTDILTLCEVQVMAIDRSHMVFERQLGKDTTSYNADTITTDLPTCAHTCKDSDDCLGINYKRDVSQCQLLNSTNSTDAGAKSGWEFYVLMP